MPELPRTKVIFKDDVLVRMCRGKRILHIGATDEPFHKERGKRGELLHQRLMSVAKSVVGMDYSRGAIKDLKRLGIDNIVFGDVMAGKFPAGISGIFDVVVFGDVLEHLDNPGIALKNIRRFVSGKTRLVITVPNVHCLHNYRSFFTGVEDVHPDHMFWPSYFTMMNIIKRNGFKVSRFSYCMWGTREDFRGVRAFLYWLLLKWKPHSASAMFFDLRSRG